VLLLELRRRAEHVDGFDARRPGLRGDERVLAVDPQMHTAPCHPAPHQPVADVDVEDGQLEYR